MDFVRPPEWEEEERMYYLLAPFPPDSNTTITDPKVAFWRSLILSSSKDLRKVTFTKRELEERFRWRGTEPRCLSVTLECMERSGYIRRLSSFSSGRSKGWMEWGVQVLSAPFTWAWTRYVSGELKNETYIITEMVKELASAVLKEHFSQVEHASTDCVLTHEDFQHLCHAVSKTSSLSSTDQNNHVTELQLLEDSKIMRHRTADGMEVVKFSQSWHERVTGISDTDLGILRIKETILVLGKKVTALQERMIKIKKSAIEFHKSKQKDQAIRLLRRYKMLQSSLDGLEKQLENLQSVLVQIQTAETDIKVMEAYKHGVTAFKSLRKEQGLQVEKVEGVMDDLKELMEDQNEIANFLAEDITGDHFDDSELEKELAALLTDPLISGPDSQVYETELDRRFAALKIVDKATPTYDKSPPTHVPITGSRTSPSCSLEGPSGSGASEKPALVKPKKKQHHGEPKRVLA